MGKRGPKKGARYKPTLQKAAAREVTRQIITGRLKRLLEAQLTNAEGLKYLVTRDKKTGKFIRVTEAMARHKQELKEHEEIIEVWEKDPNVQAFSDLMNRALDKPAEQMKVMGPDGGPVRHEMVWRRSKQSS